MYMPLGDTPSLAACGAGKQTGNFLGAMQGVLQYSAEFGAYYLADERAYPQKSMPYAYVVLDPAEGASSEAVASFLANPPLGQEITVYGRVWYEYPAPVHVNWIQAALVALQSWQPGLHETNPHTIRHEPWGCWRKPRDPHNLTYPPAGWSPEPDTPPAAPPPSEPPPSAPPPGNGNGTAPPEEDWTDLTAPPPPANGNGTAVDTPRNGYNGEEFEPEQEENGGFWEPEDAGPGLDEPYTPPPETVGPSSGAPEEGAPSSGAPEEGSRRGLAIAAALGAFFFLPVLLDRKGR